MIKIFLCLSYSTQCSEIKNCVGFESTSQLWKANVRIHISNCFQLKFSQSLKF